MTRWVTVKKALRVSIWKALTRFTRMGSLGQSMWLSPNASWSHAGARRIDSLFHLHSVRGCPATVALRAFSKNLSFGLLPREAPAVFEEFSRYAGQHWVRSDIFSLLLIQPRSIETNVSCSIFISNLFDTVDFFRSRAALPESCTLIETGRRRAGLGSALYVYSLFQGCHRLEANSKLASQKSRTDVLTSSRLQIPLRLSWSWFGKICQSLVIVLEVYRYLGCAA